MMSDKKFFDLLWKEPDGKRALQTLNEFCTLDHARKVQTQLANECRGSIEPSSPTNSAKRDEGKRLFGQEKYAESLQTYEELLTESPLDWPLYTNIALCHAKLANHKESIVNASIVARYLQQKFVKAQHRVVNSYCSLGYFQLALSYLDTLEGTLSSMERTKIDDQIESVRLRHEPRIFKVADVSDFDETITNMMAPELSDENLLFFLYHCLYHFTTGSYSPRIQGPVEIIDNVCQLNELVKFGGNDRAIELSSLSMQKQHIILVYLSFTAEYAKLSQPFAQKLIKKPSFTGFIVKLAQFFTSQNGMRDTMKARPFGQFTLAEFVKLLVALAGQPGIKKQFLLETAPFNMLEWHANLSLATFCSLPFHPPREPQDFFFDCTPYLLLEFIREDAFFAQFEDKARKSGFETALGILSFVSSFEFRTTDDPQCTMVVWSALTRNGKSAPFCVERAGIWSYAVRRLYRFADDAISSVLTSGDLLMNLGVISNLIEHFMLSTRAPDDDAPPVKLTGWNEESNAPMLGKVLSVLAAPNSSILENLQDDEIKRIANDCFTLAAHFCSRSGTFLQALAKHDFLIPQAIFALVRGRTTSKLSIPSALYYLSVVSDVPNNEYWRNRLLMNPNFKELIHRVVDVLVVSDSDDEKTKTNAILFLYHLFSTNDRCKNAAFQTLNESEERALVRMLVGSVRKKSDNGSDEAFYRRVFSISAGMLLSVLLKLDNRLCKFEEEIRKANEEPVDTAFQRVLKEAR